MEAIQKQTSTQQLNMSAKIKDIPIQGLAELIARVYLLKNRPSPPDNVFKFMLTEMQCEINKHYSYLAIEEVRDAFQNGIFGKYGEVFEISVVALCHWLDCYKNSEERVEYVRAHNPKPKAIAQTATVTKEELLQHKKEFVLSIFERFTKQQRVWYAFKCYDFLIELSLINPTKAEKKIALDVSRKKISAIKEPLEQANTHLIWESKSYIVYKYFTQVLSTEESKQAFINKLTQK